MELARTRPTEQVMKLTEEHSAPASSRAAPVQTAGGIPDLSIVIVNWNSVEYLRECIDSILHYTKGIEVEVILVDNASSDGSIAFMKEHYPEVTIIANERNFGFARGNNLAFPHCTGRYILLMNPDTRVLGDALSTMVDFMDRHPKTGIAGCRILNPDLSLQAACRRSIPTPAVAFYRLIGLSRLFPSSKRFSRYNVSFMNPDHEADVDAVSGSFLMFRREMLDDVGPLDERFFLYGEELDWCMRAKEKGWRVSYNPRAEIIHYKGGSSKRSRLRSLYEFHRAMLLFHRKHFAGKLIFPLNVLIATGVLLRGIAQGILPVIRKLTFIAIDAVAVNLAQIAAFYIKLGGPAQPHFNAYLRATPLITGATVLVMWASKLYSGEKDRDSVQITYETIRALGATAGIIVLANFISRSFASLAFPYPRFVFLLGLAIAVIPVSLIKALLLSSTLHRRAATRIGIIGTGEPANRLKEELEQRLSTGSRLIGFVTDQPVENIDGPVLGSLDDIGAVIHRFALTDIIITTGGWPPHRLMHVIAGCENSGVAVKILPNLYEILIGRFELTNLAGMPLIKLPIDPLGGWYRALKRTGDILGGALGLVLFSWLFPLVAGAIKVSSRGTVFFPQVRLGRNEREFTLLKFRTMISDAERESGPTLSTPHDPRVTRVGRFLRQTHLDELPQLLNIVRGEMSFVGPRPERPEFVELFLEQDPTYRRRFVVRPGLTGLAQVHGRYDSEPSDKLKFDLAYVNNVSFALDLRILLSSIKTIVTAFTKSFSNGPP